MNEVVDEPANHRFGPTGDGIDAQLVYPVGDGQPVLPEPKIERAT